LNAASDILVSIEIDEEEEEGEEEEKGSTVFSRSQRAGKKSTISKTSKGKSKVSKSKKSIKE